MQAILERRWLFKGHIFLFKTSVQEYYFLFNITPICVPSIVSYLEGYQETVSMIDLLKRLNLSNPLLWVLEIL